MKVLDLRCAADPEVLGDRLQSRSVAPGQAEAVALRGEQARGGLGDGRGRTDD